MGPSQRSWRPRTVAAAAVRRLLDGLAGAAALAAAGHVGRTSSTAPLVACLLALPLAAGCSNLEPAVYYHPNADFALYERVAILPLENMSTDRFAGERVREILLIELSAQGLFDVLPQGEVNRVLRIQNIPTVTDLGAEEVAALGQALGVQGLIQGSVLEFRERRTGSITAPEIALSLRLVDVETGLVVWSVTDARTGVGMWTRLFGVGQQTMSEAARRLVRELVATI